MSTAERLKPALVIGALGVVYGDIGTSPIYTFRESLKAAGEAPGKDVVLGLLSLIFWTLMIVVTIKYVIFVMRADNDGEGGIMALLGLARGAEPDPRLARFLLVAGIAGAALFYGDGMITPAISVLSAVEGLDVATLLFHPYIVPLTLVILVALFVVQSKGSAVIGAFFGPVMAIWFTVIAVVGLIQIAHEPVVLLALDPSHALRFVAGHIGVALPVLGSVFLAVTGAEALYADMGHFGRKPIRFAWFAFVLPALVLNYFGQGALVLSDPGSVDSPFYRLFPNWALYPAVILAAAATVIASQAVISGAFSLSQQAMQLSLLPRLDVRQTSSESIGQVYVPQINWLLMFAVIGLVLGFRSSDALASAYGIAVSGTMLVTTLLLGVVAHYLWRWNAAAIAAVMGILALVDAMFFISNSLKILDGGWFPLLVGAIAFTLMSTWRRGRELILQRISEDNVPIVRFLSERAPSLPRVAGTGIYLASRRDKVPYALADNVRHNKVLHERAALLTVVTERIPTVTEDARMEVEDLGSGFSRVVLHFGFAERPDVPAALEAHREQYPIDMADASFFVGRELPIPTMRPDLALWREHLFTFMTRNAVGASSYFNIPPKRVVELGVQVEL